MGGLKKRMKQTIYRLLLLIIVLGCLTEVITLCFIINQENRAIPEKSDVILVLGAHLWGENPSPFLQARLDKAMELYRNGYADVILVSGGQGADEVIPEALAMKNYLIAHQIPAEDVMMEDRSTSTRENITFSKVLMDQKGYQSAIIVTNDFHVYRGMREAHRAEIKASGASAPTEPWESKWYYRVRESLAILYYWVLDLG